jgi:hypothetical protein
VEIMEINLPGGGTGGSVGGGGQEAAARVGSLKVLYRPGGYIIEPLGRVYIDVQRTNLEYKTRHRHGVQDTYPISILI